MCLMLDLGEERLLKTQPDSEKRGGSIREQPVIVTLAIADPVARPVKSQARHQHDVDIGQRNLRRIGAWLPQAKTPRNQVALRTSMERQPRPCAICHPRPNQLG